MAYDPTNPPQKVSGGIGSGVQTFSYRSPDTVATVRGADYFSNGDDLGLRIGDIVIVSDTTTPLGTVTVVSAVTAGGAATVA